MLRRGFMALAVLGLALVLAQSASAQENRWVTVHNNTGYDIITFHASRVGTSRWGEDILGDSIVPAGHAISYNFDDGTGACLFDFRAEFSDGDVLVGNGVDVCVAANFYYR